MHVIEHIQPLGGEDSRAAFVNAWYAVTGCQALDACTVALWWSWHE